MDWERQRRDQLMAEKQREQALVDAAQAEVAKMKLELEALVSQRLMFALRCKQIRLFFTDFSDQLHVGVYVSTYHRLHSHSHKRFLPFHRMRRSRTWVSRSKRLVAA